MDNEIDDRLLPTTFTEMWFPIESTGPVLRALRDHYRSGGLNATGTYVCEIYAAKASDLWLSPAYHRDSLRVDIFWFAGNSRDPVRHFYPQFWKLLRPWKYRLHWGKALPAPQDAGPAFFEAALPRFRDFLELRDRHDPDQIFVSDYWRAQLGIPRPAESPTPAAPAGIGEP